METKFCTSCQCSRALDGGVFRVLRATSRWICVSCVERRTESIYMNKSGKTADVSKIMAKLYRRAA